MLTMESNMLVQLVTGGILTGRRFWCSALGELSYWIRGSWATWTEYLMPHDASTQTFRNEYNVSGVGFSILPFSAVARVRSHCKRYMQLTEVPPKLGNSVP